MSDYLLPLLLAVALLVSTLLAATTLLDAWIDRLRRRRARREEARAYREFLDGAWFR